MKKIIALLMIVSVLASCEEDVSFNTPAFQARKDNDDEKKTTSVKYTGDGKINLFLNSLNDLSFQFNGSGNNFSNSILLCNTLKKFIRYSSP